MLSTRTHCYGDRRHVWLGAQAGTTYTYWRVDLKNCSGHNDYYDWHSILYRRAYMIVNALTFNCLKESTSSNSPRDEALNKNRAGSPWPLRSSYPTSQGSGREAHWLRATLTSEAQPSQSASWSPNYRMDSSCLQKL